MKYKQRDYDLGVTPSIIMGISVVTRKYSTYIVKRRKKKN